MSDVGEQQRNHHHHHHHHHDTNGQDEVSFTERNRTHWNNQAASYMSPEFQKEFGDLLNKVSSFILSNINWIGVDFLDPSGTFEVPDKQSPTKEVRVLDYACGPGTITGILAGRASEFVGIDLSEKMVEEYNKRLSSNASDPKAQALNAKAFAGNLIASEDPEEAFSGPKFHDFDLVVVGLGFHHFENLEHVTARLVGRLKPGGILMIVDFLPHAKNDMGHDTTHLISHHGFTEEKVRDLFSGAGLVDVDLVVMNETVLMRGKAARTVFLARGRKV